MSSIPSHSIGVSVKILTSPPVGVLGKTHVRRNKCKDRASRKNYGPALGWMVARFEFQTRYWHRETVIIAGPDPIQSFSKAI